ncbi:MAG: GNAT family N-acetyltransferase [Bacteroidota bacterium]
MFNLTIAPYTATDDEAAVNLEQHCVQGKSLALRFRRPTFKARSDVYENYKILTAKAGGNLIGIAAGARKSVQLHGRTVDAVYLYDIRVHPDYRKYGTARQLTNAVLEEIGKGADCVYSLISGENERAIGLARRSFGAQVIIPLIYCLMPVYRKFRVDGTCNCANASEIHTRYLNANRSIEFIPPLNEEKLSGYVASIVLPDAEDGGCSIWTNENILAEEIVNVPRFFRLMRILTMPVRPFIKLPAIPKRNEIIRSWFLFDFYAKDKMCVRNLLSVVNNLALSFGRNYLYLLMQSDDPALKLARKAGFKIFNLQYFFLAKGNDIPSQAERIYLDIRDL